MRRRWKKKCLKDDAARVEEHLSAIRDLERGIEGLPAEYRRLDPLDYDGDMKDWPRIAKLQSDLLAQALVTRQTRVASYMLTKGQGLARFPWLGLTAARHHDYTHADGKAPGSDGVDGQRILRDITKWHAEEFAYLLGRLKSIPEGDGTVLDHTCLLYAHEHAEANPHKCSGLAMVLAGELPRLKTGAHSRVMGTIGDLYLTIADDIRARANSRRPRKRCARYLASSLVGRRHPDLLAGVGTWSVARGSCLARRDSSRRFAPPSRALDHG